MEGIVWQNLPEDLIEKVLATLPVSTLPKMRAVCKAWSSLILSQPFIELCARTCGRQDHLLCFTTVRTKCTLAAFNLASNNWQSSSLNFRGSKRPVFFVVAGAGLILLNDRFVDITVWRNNGFHLSTLESLLHTAYTTLLPECGLSCHLYLKLKVILVLSCCRHIRA
ncbi:hypothetical protein O6H91_19G015800 [Diphasiastrum complanatum]|uniref:Uncharacterized protein n=1 Tax=Diphasiastrum complanatum TaxID=34168 RepID=A0ACC2ASZ0_DIPCM|nr:hypothetical protein O6H91_19G015800 [Diphasiastrum complanatum]